MGLIDADELREYMEKHCEFCKRSLRIYEYLQGRCELCPMSQVYYLIDPEAGLKTHDKAVQLHLEKRSDGEKILDLCQFEWGHQKEKPLTRFYVNLCGGEEEMIEMQLEDASIERNERVDYEHVTDRNGHSYNLIKGFRKSLTLTFSGYMPNNGYGWECDKNEKADP